MEQPFAIQVQHLSKAYRIWSTPSARIAAPLYERMATRLPKFAGRNRIMEHAATKYRDFWALKNISFEVKKGESVGIVGQNGSGKSTLLQIIAGTLRASSGNVSVNGRIAALLELGSGFNPDFTGRENVYVNCSVLGLTRREIDIRFKSIADFADIGDFMDQPVKTFSSGMTMRLAFACVIHVEPDILIIDEALAVGDIRFQRKCKEWIANLTKKGVTFLFVSHSPAEVAQLTNRALLLHEGEMVRFGHSKDVVVDYQKLLFGETVTTTPAGQESSTATATISKPKTRQAISTEIRPADRQSLVKAAMGYLTPPELSTTANEIRHGNGLVQILDLGILDENGERRNVLSSGQSYVFFFRGVAVETFDRIFGAFVIRNVNGVDLFYTNTELQPVEDTSVSRGDLVEFTSQVRMWLAPGDYFLAAVTRDGDTLEALDRRLDAFHFKVMADPNSFGGLVNLEAKLDFRKLGNVAYGC